MGEQCVFCDIIAGRIPAQLVHDDERVVAFNDARPMAPVHILVVPRDHHATIGELGDHADGEALLGRLLRVAANLGAKHVAEHDGYRIVVNHGPAAGQTVYHVHVHVLSGRHFAWPPG